LYHNLDPYFTLSITIPCHDRLQDSAAPLPRPPAAPDAQFEDNFLGAVGSSSTLPPPNPADAEEAEAARRKRGPPQPIDLLVPPLVRVVAVTGVH